MVSLKNLVNRINTDTKFLEEYPEHKEMLEKRIERSKSLIIECVLQNQNNVLLEKIFL
jgi:hypothetical protein